MQEVSRVGAQGVTSKSKLLAREMPDLHTGGLRADPGAARWLKGARAGRWVDRRGSYASVRPEWKMQEVSRVGAQGVTSKSKLQARQMPRVRVRDQRRLACRSHNLSVAHSRKALCPCMKREGGPARAERARSGNANGFVD